MKILAFVDVHGSFKAIEVLEKKAKQADILVCAGDMSIFEQNLDKLLSEINKFNKRILMIPGNHETEEELKKACSKFENIKYIHKKEFKFKNYLFIAYGGGGFSEKDPEFKKWSRKYENKKNLILIIHAPPYKTNLDIIEKSHHGNNSIRNFIIKAKPLLAVCGHLHENSEKSDKIGTTKVINPGPKGKLLDI